MGNITQQIFEDAIVVDTKEDKNNDSNIKGIVDLVGCAYLGEDYIAIVKMNVKEYANNDAKLYDNRVVTIEELTVVGRDGHLIEETKRGSTSPTVSSKYILSQYRDSVNSKYSVSEKTSDTAYLSAVNRGDMETAQRMVDEESTGHPTVGTGAPTARKKGKERKKERPAWRRSFRRLLDQMTRTRSTASSAVRSASTVAGTAPVTSKMV